MDSRIEDHASCIVIYAACRHDEEAPALTTLAVDLSLEAPACSIPETDAPVRSSVRSRTAPVEADPAFKIPIA